MLRKISLGLPALVLLSGMRLAFAGDDITVTGAWARPSLGDTGASALYFTITNGGAAADSLLSADVADAARTQLHETTNDNGVVGMRPITEMPLVPGKPLVFEPKGNHVMLMGLKHALKSGDHIAATLHFKSHAPITADVVVSMVPPQ